MRPWIVLRLLCLLGLAATTTAVTVARHSPRKPARRFQSDPQRVGVDYALWTPAELKAIVLNTQTGEVETSPIPANERVQWPAFSEWVDEDGERWMVGRWAAFLGNSRGSPLREIGVARFSYPSGRRLDCVANCPLPARTPCWFPGPEPRVLYAGADGTLYQCRFGGPNPPKVQPVVWPNRRDRYREPFIERVVWPNAPLLRNRVFAAVSWVKQPGERGPVRLWWMKLNPAGTLVEEAEPMAVDEPDSNDAAEWRAPGFAQITGSDCLIGWLRYGDYTERGELVLAPLRIDPQTGELTVVASRSRTLATDMLGMPPAFSPDARWVYGLQQDPGEVPTIRRFSIDPTFR